MDIYSFAPIATVLDAAYILVTSLSDFLTPVVGPSAAALAVVLVTVIVRTLLIPVGISQVRAEFAIPSCWLPFITVAFGAAVPLAATLYLAVTTTWTLAERAILRSMLGHRGGPASMTTAAA